MAWMISPTGAFMTWGMWALLGFYLFIVNVCAFLMMGIDKRKAKKGAWRIPEKKLFLMALLGGAFGGTMGMKTFRHKTKHWYFRFGFPLLLILNVALLLALVWFNYLA